MTDAITLRKRCAAVEACLGDTLTSSSLEVHQTFPNTPSSANLHAVRIQVA
jgi:hypothetical protein